MQLDYHLNVNILSSNRVGISVACPVKKKQMNNLKLLNIWGKEKEDCNSLALNND